MSLGKSLRDLEVALETEKEDAEDRTELEWKKKESGGKRETNNHEPHACYGGEDNEVGMRDSVLVNRMEQDDDIRGVFDRGVVAVEYGLSAGSSMGFHSTFDLLTSCSRR